MKKADITDIQQARAIIDSAGEGYQIKVVDMLRGLTWELRQGECERKAQKVISNMEKEYTLNVANVLWADKYNDIPDYIKNMNKN